MELVEFHRAAAPLLVPARNEQSAEAALTEKVEGGLLEPTTALPGSEKVYEKMRAAKTSEEVVLQRGDLAALRRDWRRPHH